MSTIIEFINNNLPLENPFISAVSLGILFLIIYDFYHILFSSILTWFKK